MDTVFYCSNFGLRLNDFNFFMMGEKYMLSLLSAIIVCGIHIFLNKKAQLAPYKMISNHTTGGVLRAPCYTLLILYVLLLITPIRRMASGRTI